MNVCYPHRDEYGSLFHPHFEANLKRLIDETGAKIVISSSWRHSGLKIMQEMWIKRGLVGEVIDITPSHSDKSRDHLPFKERAERGGEIKEWLDAHPEVTNYVILDDDDDVLESQENNFVKCSENQDHEDCIDIGYGLTKKCSQMVIDILNTKK